MTLLLGTHEPSWLSRSPVPLFVSHRRLARLKKKLPRAAGPWALDSGGFSELSLYGLWQTPPGKYARAVRRYADEIGNLQWAAVQDWMCEPFMLRRTGLTIAEHQALTIDSYARLLDLAPGLPWAPVLQGYELGDYLRHADDYARRGFDLYAAPVVGVGSVCRRQRTAEAEVIMRELAALGLSLHAFGFKLLGLRRVQGYVTSSDSLAWSYQARKRAPLPGHTHKTCANCFEYALGWLALALAFLGAPRPRQLALL